jgi:arylsulfatase A-like enzyme
MAGGGIRTGQVIGATDKVAGEAIERPVHYQDVMATMYEHLGLKPSATTLVDTTGRPQYLCDTGRPIRELF